MYITILRFIFNIVLSFIRTYYEIPFIMYDNYYCDAVLVLHMPIWLFLVQSDCSATDTNMQ